MTSGNEKILVVNWLIPTIKDLLFKKSNVFINQIYSTVQALNDHYSGTIPNTTVFFLLKLSWITKEFFEKKKKGGNVGMSHCFNTANSVIRPLKFWWVRQRSFISVTFVLGTHILQPWEKRNPKQKQICFRTQLISDVVVSDNPSKSDWKVLIKNLLKSRTKRKIDVGSQNLPRLSILQLQLTRSKI